jgi:hypothetical protein
MVRQCQRPDALDLVKPPARPSLSTPFPISLVSSFPCPHPSPPQQQQHHHHHQPRAPGAALGAALEAGYVQARQVLRQSNGIRALMQLLQPRHGQGPNAVAPAALDRIRAQACRALVGLAGDPAIRQILTRLQVGPRVCVCVCVCM